MEHDASFLADLQSAVVINAAGTLSRLGGALVSPAVAVAMASAATRSFDMPRLHAAASCAISRATGAEAGLVTPGASAALTLAAAACMAGLDPAEIAALPSPPRSGRNEILIAVTHRNGYDRAFRVAGAKLIHVGTNDRGTDCGIRGPEPWEYAAQITPRTAAIAFVAFPDSMFDLPGVVRAAKAAGVPVIVDAAAQLPPLSNLRLFWDLGCDLVAFSGGKAIGGPQGSGILCGRRDLVASAFLQMVDMDVLVHPVSGWVPPPEFVPDPSVLRGAVPRHGVGRGLKVGKEQVVGLIVALEEFVARDEASWRRTVCERLRRIAGDGLPGFEVRIRNAEGGPIPVAEVDVGGAEAALALVGALLARDRPVHVDAGDVRWGKIAINLAAVASEEDEELARALREAAAGLAIK
ncbi:selenocysteine synthase-like protein [Hyaloraphidium curvatum]|nr:selenocysteine synthase-like protein [Hyaloraphidium curvatum]